MIKGYQKIFLLLANVFPLHFAPTARTHFNLEEKKKFDWIREMVVEVGKRVGISNPESVNFRITHQYSKNACMVGSVLSLGGPVMCLASDYFNHLESAEILKDPEYRAWKSWLSLLPDHPEEMADFLASCSPEERQRICSLAKKFQLVLTSQELQGIVAHEFGHAKHLHSWKMLCFLLPLGWGALMVHQAVLPYMQWTGAASIFAGGLFFLGSNLVSRMHEREADGETAVSRFYSLGLASFFKKSLLVDLASYPGDPKTEVDRMIRGFDVSFTHPHPAKRIIAALKRKEEPAQPISLIEKGIAVLGAALLVKEIMEMFPKKKKATSDRISNIRSV